MEFDRTFETQLPADPSRDTRSRRVANACFSQVAPTAVSAPRLLAWSKPVAEALALDFTAETTRARWTDVLAGNALIEGMVPIATRYGGHQFGHWAGQLGDGRAIRLGAARVPIGPLAPHGLLELQLKGAGPTPYSRRADGRAVLRSSLREYVASEAMAALGIPTTRALSLVATGDAVERDMFYDGRVEDEPGAIVCRVAESFLRFGHFEILAREGEHELLGRLFDHVAEAHFEGAFGSVDPESILAFFDTVATRTLEIAVHWQRVGFVHGVLNTDNLSVLGLTIDYGPFGFLEPFEPEWTPNTTDAAGRRYAYGRQPAVVLWNLARLAEALSALLVPHWGAERTEQRLLDRLTHHEADLERRVTAMWCAKLGLSGIEPPERFLARTFAAFAEARIDLTLFMRALSREGGAPLPTRLAATLYGPWTPRLEAWLDELETLWRAHPSEHRSEHMRRVNPRIVPRNWMLQECIDAATSGELEPLQRLMRAVERPYAEVDEEDGYAQLRPAWAEHKPGCAALSCSS